MIMGYWLTGRVWGLGCVSGKLGYGDVQIRV